MEQNERVAHLAISDTYPQLSYRVHPNYRSVVYCHAMQKDTTEDTYDFLWEEYLNSNVTADKLVILSSLACSQNKSILEK
jgi:hypothetical protein